MKEKNYTWEELSELKEGFILKDWFEDNIRCLIMKGPNALCAYLGIPIKHPLSGFDYDDIPLNCHGGLTYSGEGDGDYRPDNYYWYGWDYGHSGDYCFYYDTLYLPELRELNEKKWLIEDVESDVKFVLWDFKALANLSEKIFNKQLWKT